MSRDEASIESEIQSKNLTAPRLTPADIDAQISGCYFANACEAVRGLDGEEFIASKHEASLSCLTVCFLVLKNGFVVTGESACASPENYNREIGEKIARQNARDKIWPLEGYQLRTRLMGERRG